MRIAIDRKLVSALLLVVWLELSVVPFAAVRTVRPDLFFVFLVFYAFSVNWRRIVPIAFCLGLAKDLMTNGAFGLATASYTAGALFLQLIAVRFDREKNWVQLASLFACAWLSLAAGSVLLMMMDRAPWDSQFLFSRLSQTALYTTAVGGIAKPLFDRWLKHLLAASKQYELF